jgi:integrase
MIGLHRVMDLEEQGRLLSAANHLPNIGGRLRHKMRWRNSPAVTGQRGHNKGYRPWRNRALMYILIELGTRPTEITRIDLTDVDFSRSEVVITDKWGHRLRRSISAVTMDAVRAYLDKERPQDAVYQESPALFLPVVMSAYGTGRLARSTIGQVWIEVCELAGITGITPTAARLYYILQKALAGR